MLTTFLNSGPKRPLANSLLQFFSFQISTTMTERLPEGRGINVFIRSQAHFTDGHVIVQRIEDLLENCWNRSFTLKKSQTKETSITWPCLVSFSMMTEIDKVNRTRQNNNSDLGMYLHKQRGSVQSSCDYRIKVFMERLKAAGKQSMGTAGRGWNEAQTKKPCSFSTSWTGWL